MIAILLLHIGSGANAIRTRKLAVAYRWGLKKAFKYEAHTYN